MAEMEWEILAAAQASIHPGGIVLGPKQVMTFNPGFKPVKQDACKVWGIESTLNLTGAAADFYLLYNLFLDGKDEGEFNKLIDFIYPQVLNYTDMVVGGELRHMRKYIEKNVSFPIFLKRAMAEGTYPLDRSAAWVHWWNFRLSHGTMALQWAEQGFLFSSGGYGGPKWANICHVLRLHEEGKLPQISFLDTCWGLQHNGGVYFNKVWSSHSNTLMKVLQYNLQNNMEGLVPMASPKVAQLWEAGVK